MEKEIIKGKLYNSKKFKKIIGFILLVVAFLIFIFTFLDAKDSRDKKVEWYRDDIAFEKEMYNDYYADEYSSFEVYLEKHVCDDYYSYSDYECRYDSEDDIESTLSIWIDYMYFIYPLIPLAIYAIVFLFIKLFWDVTEITVTDKRVYGKTAFGKKVELPVDSVSSVGKRALFNTVVVATSSGNIKFAFVKNSNEVFDAISKLLVSRQNKKSDNNKNSKEELDTAEELKKYKKLLDDGIITQEEFDKKKKKLLDL